MKGSFLKLVFFLKTPFLKKDFEVFNYKDFFGILLLTLIFVVPFGLSLDYFGMDQFDSKSKDMLMSKKWLFIFSGIFLAPILEEPIFRLHLDLKKSSIWWGIGLSVFILGQAWWLWIALLGYLFFLLYQVNQGTPPSLKFVLWTSAAFFALVHMGNFTDFDYTKYFYWVPFMVGAQFIVGLVLSYIRLNHGMRWAILFHGVYNAVLIILAIYFYEV